MTDFRARTLGILDALYDFVGGTRGLSRFDLSGSIQPVHDLSREAELGSASGRNNGFYIGKCVHFHVGAGNIAVIINLYDPTNTFGTYTRLDPTKEWLWIMDVWAAVNTEDVLTFVRADLNAGTGGSPDTLLGLFEPVSFGAGAGEARRMIFFSDEEPIDGFALPRINLLPRPIPVPFAQGVMTTESIVTAAANVIVAFMLWRGPKGVLPPGIR